MPLAVEGSGHLSVSVFLSTFCPLISPLSVYLSACLPSCLSTFLPDCLTIGLLDLSAQLFQSF